MHNDAILCILMHPMARPPTITRESLAPLIRARGPVSATELASLLRVNRTTIVRALPDFGDELVTLGATRSTRYMLRRSLRNIGSCWPVYRIGEDGRATEWAEIEALHERQWRVQWVGTPPEWAGRFTSGSGRGKGFPFFLGDLRPQGFLGRIIAARISRTLQLPDDPERWSDEDTMVFLQTSGEDLPGNHVLGDDCLRRALAASADPSAGNVIPEAEGESFYQDQVARIAASLPVSSVGGKQPKFLTTLQMESGVYQPVLVKVSASIDQAVGGRWADLLLCEFIAHQVLEEVGLANSGARLLDAGGRRFLEIPRFDRVGVGGRRGVVSLEALSTSLTGALPRDWIEAAVGLHRHGLIDEESIATIRRLHAFGELIGNTDMHLGNLAFFLGDTLPLRIAPAYDMLPMLWAPGHQGELVKMPFSPAPPVPAMIEPWREAAAWAEEFWTRVSGDPWVSEEFGQKARDARATVARLRSHVGPS